MRKIVFLILLVKTVYGQTIPNSVTIQKDLRVQGKTVLGGVTKVEDVNIYADTIYMPDLDGTGDVLGIDISGNVTRTTAGGGVTGLTDKEVLFGSPTGTIDQDPRFYFDTDLYISALGNSMSLGDQSLKWDMGGNYTALYRASGGSDYNLYLPNAQGSANQFPRNDGSGNLSWVTLTEGTAIDITHGVGTTTVDLDIHELTSETSLAFDDEIPIYDVSEGAINKTTYETVLSASPTNFRNYRFTYFNEFLNTVATATGGNDIIATNSGTGAGTNNTATSAAERVGLVRSTTGSTATGRTSPGTSSTACAFGGGSWVYEIEINLTTLSTVTERYQLVLGFHDIQNAANQTDAIAFVYDEGGVSTGSAASANWQTLTASNSTRTWTTSATAVATGWVNLRIEVNAAGSSVTFYVNGTSVATHTTNIPTGTARVAGFGYLLIKSIGTTARTMDVDYIFCEQDLTTNR